MLKEEKTFELNEVDKMFFKASGVAGIIFFFVVIVFCYYVIFDARIENKSSLKVIFYILGMLILELIILTKTSRMFTLTRKKTSDYITGLFLIFFQIYFLISITLFISVFVIALM